MVTTRSVPKDTEFRTMSPRRRAGSGRLGCASVYAERLTMSRAASRPSSEAAWAGAATTPTVTVATSAVTLSRTRMRQRLAVRGARPAR